MDLEYMMASSHENAVKTYSYSRQLLSNHLLCNFDYLSEYSYNKCICNAGFFFKILSHES